MTPRPFSRLSALAAAGLALLLAAPALAQGGHGRRGGDPELRAARQELAAASLLAQLQLTAEQREQLKQALRQVQQTREGQRDEPAAQATRDQLKALVETATAEVRNDGRVSDATRKAMEDLRSQQQGVRTAHRARMQALVEQVKGVLTPEQLQTLRDFQPPFARMGQGRGDGPRPGMKGAGRGPGARGGKGPGQDLRLGLLTSDAFLRELDR